MTVVLAWDIVCSPRLHDRGACMTALLASPWRADAPPQAGAQACARWPTRQRAGGLHVQLPRRALCLGQV
eukprot:1021552-Prymnesium_polylepis.1